MIVKWLVCFLFPGLVAEIRREAYENGKQDMKALMREVIEETQRWGAENG
jgi:hypothetical protein